MSKAESLPHHETGFVFEIALFWKVILLKVANLGEYIEIRKPDV